MNKTFEEGMLDLYEKLNERVTALEAGAVIPSWSKGCESLIDKYVTRRNAITVAATVATLYFTYFVGAAVNAPLT
jgi:hypothetical protein